MGSSMGRGWRLELVAGLALALAVPVLAQAAGNAQGEATQTALSVETHDQGGRTMADLSVTVSGEDGAPAAGVLAIEEDGRQLAGDVLDSEGHAKLALDLPAGDHLLRAVYQGDATHQGSVSDAESVHAEAGATPDFSISVAPATLSLPLGQSGSVIASITPVNNSSLTAPMFVTLSCQGLPDQSSCTFTPENIEILKSSCPDPASPSCPIKSTMVVETQLGTGSLTASLKRRAGPVAWAILLPGGLVLLGLGWRRRDWAGRSSLLLVLGAVSLLGISACNERYNYFNHGPPHNPPTPAGTYKVTISAQSNNGITAVTHTATMALTVQ